jgi:hypothetical protein
MSSRRIAGLLVSVVNLIGKVLLALLLACVLWYGVYILADTECGEPKCSWLAENAFIGDSWPLLVVCVLVAAGLVWGIPAARHRRRTIRTRDS